MIPVALVLALFGGGPAAHQEPVVATHYFCWYRWPDEHFDALGQHFPAPERVDWSDPGWHERQFRDMAACGIDVALMVWWGAPGAYDRPGLRFSRGSLAPMLAAWRRLRRAGKPAPAIGLFYDTTTLRNGTRGVEPAGAGADLTTAEGLELFTRTVTDFYAELPPEAWGRLDGRPLVVLYSAGFAARWDQGLGEHLRDAFAARFPGERPLLVADTSWGRIGQDLSCQWGTALDGPWVGDGVVQLGPGYDDRLVPGRHTPVRERENGAFYAFGWQAALRARPRLVLIETWNEFHESTGIAESEEYGRRYLDLTREWVARLRREDDPGPPIVLRHPQPLPRPDLSWGEEAAGAASVVADFAAPERSLGLRPVAVADGPFERAGGALRSRGPIAGGISYLYFQVSDHWRFDQAGDFELVIEQSSGPGLGVQYDSARDEPPLHGAYAPAEPAGPPADLSGGGRRWVFHLPGARLADRENGGADFRLVLRDAPVAVRRLELRPRAPSR